MTVQFAKGVVLAILHQTQVCGSSRQHIPSITADLLGQTVSFIWPTAAKYTAYNVITSITQPQPPVCSRVDIILSLAECLPTLFGASR